MAWHDFITKKKPVRSATDDPSPSVHHYRGNSSKSVVNHAVAMQAENAMAHPIIFRCVRKIAEAVQTVDWLVEPDPKVPVNERLSKRDIQKIQDVLDYPTNDHSAVMMKFWMAANYALIGSVAFKVGINVNGLPNAIYPLKGNKLKAVFDKKGAVSKYEYGTDKQKQTFKTKRSVTSPDNDRALDDYAVKFGTLALSGDVSDTKNITGLGTIAKPAMIISLLMERALESSAGTPNVNHIVSAEKGMTVEQENKIEDFLSNASTGGDESGNILFMTSSQVNVQSLDNDLSDIHSKVPADDMVRHIAGCFGIPISMLGLGAADAGKFANNYQEGRRSFYEDTIIPGYLTPIADGLTTSLCPYGARIRFDQDNIPALQEAKVDRAAKLEKVSFLTDSEKRIACGYPADGAPAKTQKKETNDD